MARILCAWEFGGGLGHVRRLLPIARELRTSGHEVQFAFRDATSLEPVARDGFEGFAAPRLRPRARPDLSPANFSDILLNQGYEDIAGLGGALRAWHAMLAMLQPQVVVADYAPTAMLAARAHGIARVTVGTGFALPRLSDPLPALRPWAPVDDAKLRSIDAHLVGCIREALGAKQAPPQAARELFEASAHLLCTFAQVDPFGPRGDGEYLGPQGDDAEGPRTQWTEAAGPRIFAYLKPGDPRFGAVLAALRHIAADAVVAAPGLAAGAAREACDPHMRVMTHAVELGDFLERADLCISHGGPGIAARALAAGVTQALLPMTLEQLLVARRLQEDGVAEAFELEAPIANLEPWLASLLERADLREAARKRARAFDDFSFADAPRQAAARIAQVAAG
jgi:UDP:flavonoid glycosyltransferase YjiC (YdhE family)